MLSMNAQHEQLFYIDEEEFGLQEMFPIAMIAIVQWLLLSAMIEVPSTKKITNNDCKFKT